MTAGTARELVTKALRLITVLDAKEEPTTEDIEQGTDTLNDMMQHEFGDVLSSFQTERVDFTLRKGEATFTIGPSGDVPQDARNVHNIYLGYIGNTRYELKRKTESHIFAVGVTGPNPVKYLQEMKVDGSLAITVWPTPSLDVPLALSLGLRVAQITSPDDPVLVPQDARYALTYILGKRLRSAFGIPLTDVQDVITIADQKEAEWKAFSMKNTALRLRRRR